MTHISLTKAEFPVLLTKKHFCSNLLLLNKTFLNTISYIISVDKDVVNAVFVIFDYSLNSQPKK